MRVAAWIKCHAACCLVIVRRGGRRLILAISVVTFFRHLSCGLVRLGIIERRRKAKSESMLEVFKVTTPSRLPSPDAYIHICVA